MFCILAIMFLKTLTCINSLKHKDYLWFSLVLNHTRTCKYFNSDHFYLRYYCKIISFIMILSLILLFKYDYYAIQSMFGLFIFAHMFTDLFDYQSFLHLRYFFWDYFPSALRISFRNSFYEGLLAVSSPRFFLDWNVFTSSLITIMFGDVILSLYFTNLCLWDSWESWFNGHSSRKIRFSFCYIKQYATNLCEGIFYG